MARKNVAIYVQVNNRHRQNTNILPGLRIRLNPFFVKDPDQLHEMDPGRVNLHLFAD